jgi:glucokinase
MPQVRPNVPTSEAQRPVFAGIDLGATNIKIGLVDNAGRTVAFQSIPTDVGSGPEETARQIGEVVRGLIQNSGLAAGDVVAAGFGAPGPLDIPSGNILNPPNLPGWRDFPLRDRVSEYCKLPVRFTGDACAAVYGEYWLGRGEQMRSVVLFTLGTGLGCGIVIDGVLLEGRHSHGAMSGHITVDVQEEARICLCGKPGHLEAYVCGSAIVKRAIEALEYGRKTSLDSRIEHGSAVTPLVIAEEAAEGDSLCLEIVLETAMYLAVGIVSMMHTIDPDAVLIGGGINFGGADSPLGQRFLDRVLEEVRHRAFTIPAQRTIIDYATLGSDAGWIGAAGLARADYLAAQKTAR